MAVRGRCKGTNVCDYCAKLAAVENAEMLALDAIDGQGPEVYVVLTTRSTVHAPEAYYEARSQLVRALRSEFPGLEYACLLEFSTGRGSLSGGRRRPHWNLLLKGVSADDLDQVRDVVERTWCRIEDADPKAQHVGPITEAGGLMRYLALHFQKEDQSPPKGWRGQRFNCSRRYFGDRTRAEAREAARDLLRLKRELWRHDGDADAAWAALEEAKAVTWRIWWQPRPEIEKNDRGSTWWPVVEAAWRWRDERELIAQAWVSRE